MKNNKVFEFIKPVIVLTVIAAVMAALLGGTNLLTKNKIKELEEKNKIAAVKRVIVAEEYESASIDYKENSHEYFKATTGGKLVGYAFTISKNGYGGLVKSVIGLDAGGKITAIEIIDVANETPGLGQNAAKPQFANGFKGKSSTLSVVKADPKENEIQAVTGATITSTAVADSVNLAFELFAELEKEGDR